MRSIDKPVGDINPMVAAKAVSDLDNANVAFISPKALAHHLVVQGLIYVDELLQVLMRSRQFESQGIVLAAQQVALMLKHINL